MTQGPKQFDIRGSHLGNFANIIQKIYFLLTLINHIIIIDFIVYFPKIFFNFSWSLIILFAFLYVAIIFTPSVIDCRQAVGHLDWSGL